MTDFDALAILFIPSYSLHLSVSFILHQVDTINITQAYIYDYFKENSPVYINPTAESEILPIPILTLADIRAYTHNTVTNLTPLSNPSPLPLFCIQSSPVIILALPPNPIPSIANIPATNFKQIEAIEATEMRLLCINDITVSMHTWVHVHSPPQFFGNFTDIFKSPEALFIHTKIFDDDQPPLLTTLSNMAHKIPDISSHHFFNCCYIPVISHCCC